MCLFFPARCLTCGKAVRAQRLVCRACAASLPQKPFFQEFPLSQAQEGRLAVVAPLSYEKGTRRTLRRLNATNASLSDIKSIIGELDTLLTPGGVLLYLDEIQYFNKKQQQSLLEFIEDGRITLIASTTENPYFYVYNALLSRSTVFEFKPIEARDMQKAVERAFALAIGDREVPVEDGVAAHIAQAVGGDVRKALGAVELLVLGAGEQGVTLADAQQAAQRSNMRYDRDGDSHYDILSAFQKSIRGSDPDAALHYLARLLETGDMISAARRMLVIAAEDVGLAYPQCMPIVKACVDSAFQLGLPEASIPLGEAVILMATAPKSNSAALAIGAAQADVRAGKVGDIPAHIKDAHYSGAARLGRGLTYQYPHDFPNHWTPQQYLPDGLRGAHYYDYGPNKTEQAAQAYWDRVKGQK